MTRSVWARRVRRNRRRRWALSTITARRLILAAMAGVDCPGWRAYAETLR